MQFGGGTTAALGIPLWPLPFGKSKSCYIGRRPAWQPHMTLCMDPRICSLSCLQAHRDNGVSRQPKEEGKTLLIAYPCLQRRHGQTQSGNGSWSSCRTPAVGNRASAEALKAGFDTLYGDKYKVLSHSPSHKQRTAPSAVTVAAPCSASSAGHQEPCSKPRLSARPLLPL